MQQTSSHAEHPEEAKMSTDGRIVNFTKSTPDFNRKFYHLYTQKAMVDVMLSAEGQFLSAHKVVLCCASSWFEELFTSLPPHKEPVIVLKDISIALLHNIIEFIYLGTTDIHEEEVLTFKSALEGLRISLDDDESFTEEFEVSEMDETSEGQNVMSESQCEGLERSHGVLEDGQMSQDHEMSQNDSQMGRESRQDHQLSHKNHQDSQNVSQISQKDHEDEQFEAVKENHQQIKSEPNWDDVVIKEEPQERQTVTESQTDSPKVPSDIQKTSSDPQKSSSTQKPQQQPKKVPQKPQLGSLKSPIKLPSSIQLRPTSSTPKIQSFGSLVAKSSPQSSSPVIRIRTPASINEKVPKSNEPLTKTLKLVPRLPSGGLQSPSTPQNIQELSKRLSKAILIRRVKKSDGTVVNERAPIKIVQGVKISKISSQSQNSSTNSQPPMVKHIRAIINNDKKVHPIFRCTHCSKAFSVNKRRNAHEKFCFKNPSRPSSQCPYCPMVLCNPMYIATHVRKVHGVDENGKVINENESSS